MTSWEEEQKQKAKLQLDPKSITELERKRFYPPGGHHDGSMQTTEEDVLLNRASIIEEHGQKVKEYLEKKAVREIGPEYRIRPGDWKKVDYTGEKDPYGIDLKEPGSKADATKSPICQGVVQYFPLALLAVGSVSEAGAKKYSWKGWQKVNDGVNRYSDALVRHLAYESTEGPYDKDTGCLHAAQVAWNALARLELILKEMETNK